MKLYKDGAKEILFFPETVESFEISEKIYEITQLILDGHSDEYILNNFNFSEDDLCRVRKLIDTYSNGNLVDEICRDDHINYLKRLSINISNTCNMKCKYCYAKFGKYGTHEALMDQNVLRATLDKFYSMFDEIGIIQVFGGEPFMNYKGFKLICEYVEDLYNSGKIKYRTLITTVTNGSVVTKKILDLIKKYDIYVTVSLDGNKEIQNSNRVFLNGKGSFNVVYRNIQKMLKETGQPSQIEMTYNQSHVMNEFSIIKSIKFIQDNFGDIPVHIAPVSGDSKECFTLKNRDAFKKSIDEIFNYNRKNKIKINYMILDSMLRALNSKVKKTKFCDAGIDLFSVSHTGYIYPCYMFINEVGFSLGNVLDDSLTRDILYSMASPYREYDRTKDSCKNCALINICDGCMGINYFNMGDIHTPVPVDCDMKNEMFKNILFNIYS